MHVGQATTAAHEAARRAASTLVRLICDHTSNVSTRSSQKLCTQGLGWVREMLRLTVAPALPEGAEMPRIIHSDELDFMDKAWWLAFQYVIVAHDRYNHEQLSLKVVYD